MANNKPYMIIETEEQFNEITDKFFNTGYSNGFRDGRINGLSHFVGLIDKEFETQEINTAGKEAKDREIGNWQREQEFRKILKEQAVEEYVKSLNNKES